MALVKTITLRHNASFLIFVLWVCIAQALQREHVRLEKIWQDIAIEEKYEFLTPQVYIHCDCCKNRDNCKTACDDSQGSLTEICITRNVSTRAQGSIKLRPSSQENYFTAYKINHVRQQVYFRISYPTGHGRQQIDVPRGIFRIKILDDSILKLDTSSIKIDVLNAFTWFYGEKDGNNIRCETEINEVDEKSPSKLGWYRLKMATGKYDVDEEAVKNNLVIDDSGCPVEDVTWTFHGVHYYNSHGLLQSNLPGKTINEITGGIVDDVEIKPRDKTITIGYNKNSNLVNFLPAYTTESFNFSATLTLDEYHNKLIHVTIYEVKATVVNVEVGIPGTTRSMMSFYHEKPNQIHHYRISASVIGSQWVCAYPSDEIKRTTCVNAEYHDDSVPTSRNNLDSSRYNFNYYSYSRNQSFSKNEITEQFSRAGDDGNTNMNVIYINISIICILVCMFTGVGFFLLRNNRCFVQCGQNTDVRPDTV